MHHEIRIFSFSDPEYKKALELRFRVLRQPLGLQFTTAELKKDKADIHFGLFEGNKIVACLILSENEKGRMKMRQVAVEQNMQGKGYGKELSQAAEDYALQLGFNTMFCNARKSAVPFYERLGYNIVSDEFSEIGLPHYIMEKRLR